MSRIIIAPVGEQIGAVLAPLARGSVLAPGQDDVVVLVASDVTREVADRLEDVARFPRVERIDDCPKRSLTEQHLTTVATLSRGQDVVLLANGGPTDWLPGLVEVLRGCSRSFAVVETRGRDGYLLAVTGSWQSGPVTVPDIGLACLLYALEAMYQDSELRSIKAPRGSGLTGISDVHESSGQLYLAVDVASWPEEKQDRLSHYRRRWLLHAELRKLSVEPRRVFFHHDGGPPPERAGFRPLWRRMREDGFCVAWQRYTIKTWGKDVMDGVAASRPEKQYPGEGRTPPVRPSDVAGHARPTWSNGTLVTTMGTEPSTTLQAVWSHQPADIVLVHDTQQPLGQELVTRLAADSELGARVEPVAWDRHKGLDGLFRALDAKCRRSGPLRVELRPGDKLFTVGLLLWALEAPRKRELWLLEGQKVARVYTSEGRGTTGEHSLGGRPVPLRTWVRIGSPARMGYAARQSWSRANPPADILKDLSSAIVAWLCRCRRGDEVTMLDRLWRRGEHGLYVTQDAVHLQEDGAAPRSRPFADLQRVAPGIKNDFFADDGKPRGAWFDWVVGTAVAAAHDEVLVTQRYGWRHTDERTAEHHRDELDVVSRLGSTYFHWSCKTRCKQKNLLADLEEAQGQAFRLLGRRSKAVLVKPRLFADGLVALGRNLGDRWQEGPGGSGVWEVRGLGWVVDAVGLSKPDHLRGIPH